MVELSNLKVKLFIKNNIVWYEGLKSKRHYLGVIK